MTTYLEILKTLEEKAATTSGDAWHVSLYSDGSGELIAPNNKPFIGFNDLPELIETAELMIKINDDYPCTSFSEEGLYNQFKEAIADDVLKK